MLRMRSYLIRPQLNWGVSQQMESAFVKEVELWIEAEHWAPGLWQPVDDVTDAIVTLVDGTRWIATFCAFAHILTLRQNCADNGECLGGKYLWASDLILIDDTSRPSIEAAVQDLLRTGEFRSAFRECEAGSDAAAG